VPPVVAGVLCGPEFALATLSVAPPVTADVVDVVDEAAEVVSDEFWLDEVHDVSNVAAATRMNPEEMFFISYSGSLVAYRRFEARAVGVEAVFPRRLASLSPSHHWRGNSREYCHPE
jgi:hypothetical protein